MWGWLTPNACVRGWHEIHHEFRTLREEAICKLLVRPSLEFGMGQKNGEKVLRTSWKPLKSGDRVATSRKRSPQNWIKHLVDVCLHGISFYLMPFENCDVTLSRLHPNLGNIQPPLKHTLCPVCKKGSLGKAPHKLLQMGWIWWRNGWRCCKWTLPMESILPISSVVVLQNTADTAPRSGWQLQFGYQFVDGNWSSYSI